VESNQVSEMSKSSQTGKTSKAGTNAAIAKDWTLVSAFLRENVNLIREDAELLGDLGLWVKADNIVEFGPAALTRLSADKSRERAARTQVEATARANFAAQAQTHATVVELLDARNHADLARRVDETARLRFGLVAGVIALERPGGIPAGWRALPDEGTDGLLGPTSLGRMGAPRAAQALFDERADQVASVALVRLAIWTPARQGLLAFGSADPEAFTAEMGVELVAFLARVVERTAERWPTL
jgi:uncharacterized protein YigA (DUF484 family)